MHIKWGLLLFSHNHDQAIKDKQMLTGEGKKCMLQQLIISMYNLVQSFVSSLPFLTFPPSPSFSRDKMHCP